MSDYLFKLKVLYWLLSDACGTWKKEIWHKDLDETYCCDGRECGCGGMTNREMWEISK